MKSKGPFHTYSEITTQTQAWAQALERARAVALPAADDYDLVLFTGCGSTYYLSLAAAALYQELTGRTARAVPAGELLLNPQTILTGQRTLLVAVSRSGMTTETVRAAEIFKAGKGGQVVVISSHDESLSRLADVNIVVPAGQEKSVAQTRSFASMYVAATAFCARLARRPDLISALAGLPAAGDRLIDKHEAFAKSLGGNLGFDRYYFLGSGIRYGLACEANLKMKEMSLTHSEPFHCLEFRHGPMSMVDRNTVVLGMLSDADRAAEAGVLSEMAALGATVASLGESDADVTFESGIPESLRSVLYLPVLQLMAFHRSLAKGLNPDKPNNLSAVVRLDLKEVNTNSIQAQPVSFKSTSKGEKNE